MNYESWYGSRRAQLGSLWRPNRYAQAGRQSGYGSRVSGYGRSSGGIGTFRRGLASQNQRRNGQSRLRAYRRGYYQPGVASSGVPAQAGGFAGQPAGSPWVQWAQSCLAQVVGSWVPQSGTIGRLTQQAIRIFQTQQQIPATGLLDSNTVNALQADCTGQGGASPTPPAPPVIALPVAAGDDAAAASAAAASAAGAAPDESAGEFERGRRRGFGRLAVYQPDDDSNSDGYSAPALWRRRSR